jgi:hypothetical protein
VSSSDPGQRARLNAAKLAALVRPHLGNEPPEPVQAPFGAGLLAGPAAWALLDGSPLVAFGPALVWADRQGATELNLLAEADTGVLARRAACFADPPRAWRVDGTELVPAAADPVPVAAPAEPAPDLAGLLVDAGLEVLVEDGTVRGEVAGLEVARIVHHRSSSGVPLDAPLLEVGVGQADRELTSMLHGALTPTDQLARVVDIVRQHRRPGAERHPLNQLVPDRWLRSRLIAHPERLGLATLRPIETAVPRPNLREPGAAAAIGTTAEGETVVVVCSVGVLLDLVPQAADTRQAAAPGARLVLVVPERDAHPVTRTLAARLVDPAEVVALPGDWRE